MARSIESSRSSQALKKSPAQQFFQAVYVRDYVHARDWLDLGCATRYQEPVTGNTALHVLCTRLSERLEVAELINCLQLIRDIASQPFCMEIDVTNELGKTAVYLALEAAALEADDAPLLWHGLCAAKILVDLGQAEIEGGEWRSDRLLTSLADEKRAIFNDYFSSFIDKHIMALTLNEGEAMLAALEIRVDEVEAKQPAEPKLTCPFYLMPLRDRMRHTLFDGDVVNDEAAEQHRLLSDARAKL